MNLLGKQLFAPSCTTTLQQEGFIGSLYLPTTPVCPEKALLVVSGGEGSFTAAQCTAQQFAKQGFAALALAYWNQKGLPDTMSCIPLETAARAAAWLHRLGYQKVGMWGISKGAEYTLLCASHFPSLFSCAIAVSPINACLQGFQMTGRKHLLMKPLPHSSFTLDEKELPYVETPQNNRVLLCDWLRRRSFAMRSNYKGIAEKAPFEKQIPVEKINGPILLLAAEQDDMWDSCGACRAMLRRLRQQDFSHPAFYFHYPYASHMLVPFFTFGRNLFAIERRFPKECIQSNRDAFRKTIQFLKQW